MLVSWLRHKASVEILQYTLRSQFKASLLRRKIIQSLPQENSGMVKVEQKLVRQHMWYIQCTNFSKVKTIFFVFKTLCTDRVRYGMKKIIPYFRTVPQFTRKYRK